MTGGNGGHGREGDSRKTYIVTLDLPGKMQAFVKNGLKIPDDAFFHNIQSNLINKLQEILPQYRVEGIQCNDIYNSIAAFVHELTVGKEMLVVSSVPELVDKLNGVHLQANRIVDCQGNLLGLGPRPGYSSIESQFTEIGFHSGQWPLILVEDGSFTGGTICTVLEASRARHIKLNFLVIGLLFDEARNTISKFQGETKIQAVHEWEKDDFIDWVPDYDFLPFVPNSGRVVGHVYNNTIMPTYLHNGLTLSMPYILPYGRPVDWASLPNDPQIVTAFSLDCIRSARAIFEEMESLNHRHIIFGDLIGTYPRASFPVTPHAHNFPEIEGRIVEILSEDAQFIC